MHPTRPASSNRYIPASQSAVSPPGSPTGSTMSSVSGFSGPSGPSGYPYDSSSTDQMAHQLAGMHLSSAPPAPPAPPLRPGSAMSTVRTVKGRRTARAYYDLSQEQIPRPMSPNFGSHPVGHQLDSAVASVSATSATSATARFPNSAPSANFNSNYNSNSNSNSYPSSAPLPASEIDTAWDTQTFVPEANSARPIDVASLPSVPNIRRAALAAYWATPYRTFDQSLPPYPGTDYTVEDQGNSSPRFVRLVSANIPVSEDVAGKTGVPLGLIVAPFAPIRPGDTPIGNTDFSNSRFGPPRCDRCRAYVNPFMQLAKGGTRLVCNLCQFSSEIAEEYFSPLDASGRRIDLAERPELQFGSVDLIVGKDYWAEPDVAPEPLRHVFLVDVSTESAQKGVPALAVEAIRQALYHSDGTSRLPSGSRVGIVAFDRRLHMFNLSSGLRHVQCAVVSELKEPFVPFARGLFADPAESQFIIEEVLDRIEQMASGHTVAEPAYFGALQMAHTMLQPHGGGKVICLLGALPTWGPGALGLAAGAAAGTGGAALGATGGAARAGTSPGNNPAGEFDKSLYLCNNEEYLKLGQKYATSGIGLDVFTFATGHIDLVTVGVVAAVTGGRSFHYPNFVYERDGRKILAEVCRSVQKFTGYRAQVKVRCSVGLRVSQYLGNFARTNRSEDPTLPIVDGDQTFAVEFQHDGVLTPGRDCHFQVAVLYTSRDGLRRVRIHNLVASVTPRARAVFNFIDESALLALYTRQVVADLPRRSAVEIKAAVLQRYVGLLAHYRQLVTDKNSLLNQLLLPECINGSVALVASLLKSKLLRSGAGISLDTKVHFMRLVNSLSAETLGLLLYPLIVPLHSLGDGEAVWDSASGRFVMPQTIRASAMWIEAGGVYLAFNGQTLLLFIHQEAPESVLESLFGPGAQITRLDATLNEFPEVSGSVLNTQARNLVKHFAGMVDTDFLPLQLCRAGIDGAEIEFQQYILVEDRQGDNASYAEFLVRVHRRMRERVNEEDGSDRHTGKFHLDALGLMSL